MEVSAFFLFLFPLVTIGQFPLEPNLPDPRLVLVGPTGSGKSSMANALLGCDPKSSDCMFNVCHDFGSCTKQTTYGTGRWLGVGENFTVVDTPGFGDSDGEDPILVEEMLTVLKDTIKHSSTILLVLKGTETRFDDPLQGMLTEMSMIFGEQWWDYIVIGVSFWKFSEDAIDGREENCEYYPEACKNEDWYKREINKNIAEIFHVQKNFTYAFIDSYSQAKPGIDHPVEQEHFAEETEVLWKETSSRNSTIFFKGIDDVLHENAEMKEKIKWLEDVITKNITELISRMEANEEDDRAQNKTIDQNKAEAITERNLLHSTITNNNETINKRIDQVYNGLSDANMDLFLSIQANEEGDKAQNKTIDRNEDNAITERNLLRSIITNNYDTINMRIDQVDEGLGDANMNLLHLEEDLIPGIGSIIPWIPNPEGPDAILQNKIPTGWQKCDGSQILSGPLINLRTPNLNSEGLFLRGGPDSVVTTVQDDMVLDHAHIDPGHTHSDDGHKHTQSSHQHQPQGNDNIDGANLHHYPIYNHPNVEGTEMKIPGLEYQSGHSWSVHWGSTTTSATPTIHTAYASIQSAKTDVSTVADHYKKGHENRPKNMVVTYIMRIF